MTFGRIICSAAIITNYQEKITLVISLSHLPTKSSVYKSFDFRTSATDIQKPLIIRTFEKEFEDQLYKCFLFCKTTWEL